MKLSIHDINLDDITDIKHKNILRELRDEPKAVIRTRYNLSYTGLNYILKKYNIDNSTLLSGRGKAAEQFGKYHIRIGSNIIFYRNQAGFHDRAQLADLIKINPAKLQMIESGNSEITLSMLVAVSEVCAVSLEKLVEMPKDD